MKKIVIIGAGISGLTAAYDLAKRRHQGLGIDFVVLEKDERVGGKVRGERIGDYIVEGGPDCFILDKPWALFLAKELGLEDDLINTNDAYKGSYILSRGRLHEIPEGLIMMVPTKIIPFVTTGLFSWGGKLRMALDLFIPRKKNVEDESLESFVVRRLGREALDRIAEPLVGGIHAGDAKTMSILATFPRFIDMEQNHGNLIRGMLASRKKAAEAAKNRPPGPKRTFFISMREGMTELTDRLAEEVGHDRIRTGTVVKDITKTDGGYCIELTGGERLQADAVICTAPTFDAAAMLGKIDRDLAAELLRIPYRSSATVSLAYDRRDIDHDLQGYGFVVPKVEGRDIMAATWSSQKWVNRAPSGKVLIRAFVGGPHGQAQLELDDAAMTKMVQRELADIMGIQGEPELVKIYRWEKGMPQYIVGHLEVVAKIDSYAARHSGLFLAGAAYRGIGLPDCINNANKVTEEALKYLGLGDQESSTDDRRLSTARD